MTMAIFAIGAVLLGTLLAVVAWRRPPRTAPIADASGRPLPGSIACVERVVLGGVEQRLIEVPVYFLEGRYDYEAPAVLAERYFQLLKAPRKELIWFERSAHFVNTEEADAFNRFFVDRLLQETHRPAIHGVPEGPSS
jgi:pimeloyl-ACP methyl ester carboxylesterase